MKHPDCTHECTSNCRREGCNCLCGEYHDTLDQDELDEIMEETNSMEEKLTRLFTEEVTNADFPPNWNKFN